MKWPDFVIRFIGRRIADKLNLREDKDMDGSKPWYQSRNISGSIVIAALGIYGSLQTAKGWPPVPEWVYTILAAIGIYTRATATTTITK